MEFTKPRGGLFLRYMLKLAVSAVGAVLLLTAMMFVADVSADAASISSCTVSALPSRSYTGYAITPDLTVTYQGKTLKENTDYTVTCQNNINVGTATVTVTGKGDYSGSRTLSFAIKPLALSNANVKISVASKFSYTGKALTPEVKVTYGVATYTQGKDYTVTYKNNVNTGTATVTVTGKGGLTGTKSATFEIVQLPLSKAKITVASKFSYTGKALMPEVKVTYGIATYTQDKDYTVTYKNNVNTGMATVTVTGKGGMTGTGSATFEIVQLSLSKAKITVASKFSYTGKALTPEVKVTYGIATYTQDKDYTVTYKNNVNTGTATVTVTGKGGLTGTGSATFEIVQLPLSKAKITVSGVTYTGAALKPEVKVTYGIATYTLNKDYTVTYANNTNVGTATVTVTGKGGMTGTASVSFNIAAADISKATVEITSNKGGYAASVQYGGLILTQSKDYTIFFTKSGSSMVALITGTGNFTGTKSVLFDENGNQLYDDEIEQQKIKDRLDAMMAGEYGRQINSYWHSYKLGDYYNTLLYSPCTCHDYCNTGYEDGCTCLIGRSNVLGSGFSGIQCAGFAFEVFEYLFGGTNGTGENTLTRYGSAYGNWSVEGIKQAFTANLRPGDYLAYTNVKYGYDHYVIVYDVDDEGVWVYEANYGGRCKINLRRMTFKEFYEQTDDLYHRTPNNYELSDM